jgi:hypothetical protein
MTFCDGDVCGVMHRAAAPKTFKCLGRLRKSLHSAKKKFQNRFDR